MKHLYIFEDGTAAVHNDPTPEDLQAANEGILTIFRFVPGSLRGEIQEYNPHSKHHVPWDPVPQAQIESDGKGGLYHTLPKDEQDEHLDL